MKQKTRSKKLLDPVAARAERIRWFLEARFGMFIHWGLYAIPARGEWVRSIEKIGNEAYQRYFEEFNPTRYDPKAWAGLAKQAGMKYAVMTAKHHDGFCLFDSQLTDYKATNTRAGRDLVGEYVRAFREAGLKVGLYYSLLDWHHAHYPAYGDPFHPMREDEAYKDQPRDFSVYLDYLHGQVRELLTNYGQIDIMWFDFSYERLTGEAWRASELVREARARQPHILIDNRLGASGTSNLTPQAAAYAGDFACPEQIIPPEGLVDEHGQPVPWEACLTLNNHWGYCAADRDYKSPAQVIRALVECVSKNGNMLLNVGPDARGEIPAECQRILVEVGEWMRHNGDSVYGCGRAAWPKPDWGRYTQRGQSLYAHVYERGIGPSNFRGLAGKLKKARWLADGSELNLGRPWMAGDYNQDTFIEFPTSRLPDEVDTVVELELASPI
ncbi:MAG: alpha-L-fucosidase [Thermoflexales bacterium]|nr:alpha-L-fucosidase [Thermoflexales bacterium]